MKMPLKQRRETPLLLDLSAYDGLSDYKEYVFIVCDGYPTRTVLKALDYCSKRVYLSNGNVDVISKWLPLQKYLREYLEKNNEWQRPSNDCAGKQAHSY